MVISNYVNQREACIDEYLHDGLIYCAKCNTAKQTIIDGNYLPTMCECRKAEAEQEERKTRAEHMEIVRAKYIPIAEYRNHRFGKDDGQTPRTKLICERYVEKFTDMKTKGMGLLFFGSVGTGKTFYEYCIANELIDRGYSVSATSLISIIDEVSKSKKTIDELIEQHIAKDLIILDDLGTQRETGFADEKVHKFIDAVYASKTPLIASTNLDVEAMRAEADGKLTNNSRIYDRILDRCYPIRLTSIQRRKINSVNNRAEMESILEILK